MVERTHAQIAYDKAMADIRKGLTFAQGAPGAEVAMVEAHKQMVREGTAAPIKRKYSNGRYLKKVR